MELELVDDVLRIEQLIIRDFAAGKISEDLTFEIRRTAGEGLMKTGKTAEIK